LEQPEASIGYAQNRNGLCSARLPTLYTVGVRETLQHRDDSCPVVNSGTWSAWVMCHDEELDIH